MIVMDKERISLRSLFHIPGASSPFVDVGTSGDNGQGKDFSEKLVLHPRCIPGDASSP